MSSLPDTIENQVLNALFGVATFPAVTTPIKIRLMTANGTDAANGTEVTGGTYAPQTFTPTTATTGSSSNSNKITFTGMPACTVVGAEIWDSAGTPRRIWYAPLAASRTIEAGQTVEFPIGAATFLLD